MKRTLLIGSAILALGAITTFVVSSSCALFVDPTIAEPSHGRVINESGSWDLLKFERRTVSLLDSNRTNQGLPFEDVVTAHPPTLLPRWSDLDAAPTLYDPDQRGGPMGGERRVVLAAGWPMVAAQGQLIVEGGESENWTSHGARSAILTGLPAWSSLYPRAVPLQIIPMGFVCDTILYAACFAGVGFVARRFGCTMRPGQ